MLENDRSDLVCGCFYLPIQDSEEKKEGTKGLHFFIFTE